MIRFLFLSFLLLAPAIAAAQSQPRVAGIRDEVYYTLDDGIMSPEEMEMEATDMYNLCNANPFQNTYLDCKCLAGAFLIQREKDGPLTPQDEIYDNVLKSRTANCANMEAIAGETYKSCMSFGITYREMARDNPEYCECVANTVAQKFSKAPFIGTSYISRLNIDAMTNCEDPLKRPKKTAVQDNALPFRNLN